MYQVAIVEDSRQDAEVLMQMLKEFEVQNKENFHWILFQNSDEFLSYGKKDFDLVFMDIEMPGLNGMDTATEMRKTDPDVTLIFITNMAQYALRGYTVDAVDFILKPLNYYSFSMKLKKALRNIRCRKQEFITLKTSDGIFRIPVSDIYYVEVQGHYLTYYTNKGNFVLRATMTDAENQLPARQFLRCSNSYLVNAAYITSAKNSALILNNREFSISRARKDSFFQSFARYLGGSV